MTTERTLGRKASEHLIRRCRDLIRAIKAGIQGTLQAAGDREASREPSACPWVRAVPKLMVRVRFPSPAPHAKALPHKRIGRHPLLGSDARSPWSSSMSDL
jgi:hypothetical protein